MNASDVSSLLLVIVCCVSHCVSLMVVGGFGVLFSGVLVKTSLHCSWYVFGGFECVFQEL